MPTADGDILRVVAKMSYDGSDVQNVYHVQASVTSDPGDSTVVSEIADWLDTAYDEIDGAMDNLVTFDSVAVWNETTSTFLGETTWPVLTAGGSATDPLAPQLAGLALFNTNVNRSQGRKFLPPFTEGNNDTDGTPTTATVGIIGNYIAQILTGISGTGWSGEPGNWNVDLARFVPWVYGIAKDFWATQRRRYRNSGS